MYKQVFDDLEQTEMASAPPPKKPQPAAQPGVKPAPVQQRTVPAGQPIPAGQNPQPKPQSLSPQPQPDEEGANDSPGGINRFILFNAAPSWLVSMVVHAIMLLILGMLTFSDEIKNAVNELVVDNEREEQEELEEFEIEEIVPIDVQAFEKTVGPESISQPLAVDTVTPDEFMSTDIDVAPAAVELSDFGEQTAPKNNLLQEMGSVSGTGVTGRGSAKMRGDMVKKFGGTEGSEKAVAAALKWLSEHQIHGNSSNGAWNFDHRPCGSCRGQCDGEGKADQAQNGATAMALLPFLGAGQTHLEGTYKMVVGDGLDYLIRSQKPDGSFHEAGGSMYSHGLCAIVLCEAYAMTQDKRLIGPAQGSLNFIVSAQDPVGGGWRYSPRQAGDTSAVGWQLMALKSGHMGYLQVPPNVIRGAVKFLDTVQADSGAFYGYTGPGKGAATTAIGLLSRMYLGWDKDHPALERGVQFLSEHGPMIGKGSANMYYNYYATQVMRHYEGEEWEKWNTKIRDFLVESQDKEGHMTGSWGFKGDHGADSGGRLYSTSMSTMVLEVYYRHMPIYGKAAAKEDFPL